MDDPLNTPEEQPPEQPREHLNKPGHTEEQAPDTVTPFIENVHHEQNDTVSNSSGKSENPQEDAPEQIAKLAPYVVIPFTVNVHGELSEARNLAAESIPSDELVFARPRAPLPEGVPLDDSASRKRNFRHNLSLLLALTLAAFTLTAWILVRVDSPFGIFSSGPQEIVRAQLRALDHGDLRPAYDMFSARYRGQVSFDVWHKLIVTHWRMFHAQVLRSEAPSQAGPGVTLEIYLHGADDKDYRARFTLIHTDGRWWIDDVHWAEEPDQRDLSRT